MDNCKILTVGTPCYDGTITTEHYSSMLKLIKESNGHGYNIRVVTMDKDSLVTRARNNIVRIFMDDPYESSHLIFIDNDIGFDSESIWRMLAYDKDIVCGIYPKKTIEWERAKIGLEKNPNITPDILHSYCLNYNVNLKDDDRVNIENGFAEVLDTPTGFMLIKRRVFFKMKKRYPELKFIPEPKEFQSDNNYAFFDTMIEPESKRYLSEDYTFCRRWQNLGGKIYADLLSKLCHTGVYTFKGNIQIYFRSDDVPRESDESNKDSKDNKNGSKSEN